MEKIGSFTKNSLMTIGSQGIIILFGMGSSIIVARALNPEGKGIYTMAVLLPTFLMSFVNGGIGLAALYFTGNRKYEPQVILGNSIIAACTHSLLAIVVGFIIITFFQDQIFPGIAYRYLILALLIVPFQVILSFLLPMMLGLQEVFSYNIFQVLYSVSIFTMVVFLLIGLDTGVTGAISTELLSGFLFSVVLCMMLIKKTKGISFSINKAYLIDAYRYGAKLYIGGLLFLLSNRINLILINRFLTPATVGVFTIGLGLVEKGWLVADAIGVILFSRIASKEEGNNEDDFIALIFRTTTLIMVFIVIPLYFWGGRLIVLLYSPSFQSAVDPFQILLPGLIASSGWRIIENALNGRGNPGIAALLMVVSLVANVTLNLILIPIAGLNGAAWATSLSAVVTLLSAIYVFCRISGQMRMQFVMINKNDLILCKQLISSLATNLRSIIIK